MPSAFVGKKGTHIVSNSESNNEIESLGSSLTDDKEILVCLLNLPFISFNKKQRHAKCRKNYNRKTRPKKKAETLVTEYNQNHFYICDSNVKHCHLNLPEDMVEDNPLDLPRKHQGETG